MRAVWSLWSEPYRKSSGFVWDDDGVHCLSWALSVSLARPHFDSLALYTDDAGAALLVDRLGLKFDHVSTELNALNSADPDWWMQGKLATYALQQAPFVHIDADVYLFRPLPERMLQAPLLAQNPEPLPKASVYYDNDACELAIRCRGDGFVPPEWLWYSTFGGAQEAACCGIFGGHRLDLIAAYASAVLQMLRNPANRRAFDLLPHKRQKNPFFEQYLLVAFARYHRTPIEYLFASGDAAAAGAGEAGFAHLMADAKRNPEIVERLRRRVARDFPQLYARCRAVGAGSRIQMSFA